jgi:hypothetical protein
VRVQGRYGARTAGAIPAQRASMGMWPRVDRLVAEEALGALEQGAQAPS